MTFIAGGYTSSFNALNIGQFEDGINLEFFLGGDEVRGDNYGDITQDIIARGGDVFISGTLIEYDLALASKAFWYLSVSATPLHFGKIDDGYIGRLAVNGGTGGLCKTLVLTKVSGPNSSPTTLTALGCILAPRFNVSLLMAPRLKRVPIRFQLLPYNVASGTTPVPGNYFFSA